MGLFNWFTNMLTNGSGIYESTADDSLSMNTPFESEPFEHGIEINPANGLPMIDDIGGVDIEGNPYGTDSNQDDNFGIDTDDWWPKGTKQTKKGPK